MEIYILFLVRVSDGHKWVIKAFDDEAKALNMAELLDSTWPIENYYRKVESTYLEKGE